MALLNFAGDIDDLSEEAQHLIESGVILIKCSKSFQGIYLKVSTRLDIDECYALVNQYGLIRFGRPIAKIGIGDYMRGYVDFWF